MTLTASASDGLELASQLNSFILVVTLSYSGVVAGTCTPFEATGDAGSNDGDTFNLTY